VSTGVPGDEAGNVLDGGVGDEFGDVVLESLKAEDSLSVGGVLIIAPV